MRGQGPPVDVRAAHRRAQVIQTAGLQVGDRLADGRTRSHATATEFAKLAPCDPRGWAAALTHNQREVGMSTDVVASSRPRKAGAAPMNRGSSRAWRRLSVVSVALLLAAALFGPDTAIAAEPTSGYSQTAPTPKTTPSKTTPTAGTSPSKEEKTGEKTTPSKGSAPSTSTTTTPTSGTAPSKEKASTLPFTGFDLRWAVGVGLLLLGTGFSIVLVERRQRRRAGR